MKEGSDWSERLVLRRLGHRQLLSRVATPSLASFRAGWFIN